MQTRKKEFVQTGEDLCDHCFETLPCIIQPVFFSQAQHCERKHTQVAMEKIYYINLRAWYSLDKISNFFSDNNNFRLQFSYSSWSGKSSRKF